MRSRPRKYRKNSRRESGWHVEVRVLKMERRTAVYISTPQDFVRAVGGQLVITVVFPEGEVQIDQFKKVREEKQPQKMASVRQR